MPDIISTPQEKAREFVWLRKRSQWHAFRCALATIFALTALIVVGLTRTPSLQLTRYVILPTMILIFVLCTIDLIGILRALFRASQCPFCGFKSLPGMYPVGGIHCRRCGKAAEVV